MNGHSEHNTTKKILDIFEFISGGTSTEYSLSEIAEGISSAKSSIQPILHTLSDHNYLFYNPATRKYSIGVQLFEAGKSFLNNNDNSNIMLKVMQKIVDQCGEACNYAQLFESTVVVLLRIESPAPIRMHTNTGRKVPIHCSALGKALISDMTDQEIKELVAGKMDRYTPNTILDFDTFIHQIHLYQNSGFFYDHKEHSPDVCGIAVPLVKDGHNYAALSVPVPAYRLTSEKELLIKDLLLQAKEEAEQILKHIPTGEKV